MINNNKFFINDIECVALIGWCPNIDEIIRINKSFNLKTLVNQSYYSWENQIETIQSGDYKLYQVIFNNQVESYFIINENGYIPQFETVFDNEETWKRLFTGIGKISKTIKINNIDEQLEHKISQVLKFGLANTIDQYEMELLIK